MKVRLCKVFGARLLAAAPTNLRGENDEEKNLKKNNPNDHNPRNRQLLNSAGMAGLYAALVVALFPLCNGKIFTNDWAVKVAHRDAADRIAEKHGFTNMGQVG